MSIAGIGGVYGKTTFAASAKDSKKYNAGKVNIYNGQTDEAVISAEGMQAAEKNAGRFSGMKSMTRNAEFDNMLKDIKEQTGDLEINWNAAVDPDGSIYAKAYAESIVMQYQEAEKNIMEYYSGAHKENLSFDNPYNHIYAKYISNDLFPESRYFRSDMSEQERKMAFYQERAMLWGSHVNLNDPYALASYGGVLTMDKVESTARKYAKEKLDILIRERKEALNIDDTESEKEKIEKSKETDESSKSYGGSVKFNEEKRARQLRAAQTPEDIRVLMNLLAADLSECKSGLQKGWCDDAEVAKVEAMIQKAKEHMSQISGKEGTQMGNSIFELNMLM